MPPQAANQHQDSPDSRRTDKAATTHLIVASNRASISFGTGESRNGDHPLVSSNQTITRISIATTSDERAAAKQANGGLITRGMPEGSAARLITPSRRALHRYYNIICNPLLWFLHHRSWGFTHTPNIDREAHTAWEQGFGTVSRMFAEEIATDAELHGNDVTIELDEYHMHLVGGMVREKLPDVRVSYSPQVPWPGPSDWLMLPSSWRSAIFASVLACDIVELPSRRDIRSLLSCIEEFVPGVEIDRSSCVASDSKGHMLQVRVRQPVIDLETLRTVAGSDRSQVYVTRFDSDGRYTFVTTERTEPHKNIVRCIRAYGNLLNQEKGLAEETRYLVVLAPPPPHLSQYRRYLSEIEKAAKEVNGRHRTQAGKAVELIIENNYPMALAAMTIADTLVSVPIADASSSTQFSTPLINQRDCTLVLSETTGAAEMYGDAATLVSPSDIEAIKNAMFEAVELTDVEREERFARAESAGLQHATQSESDAQDPLNT